MIREIFTRHPHALVAVLLAVGLLTTFGWGLYAPTFMAHDSSMLQLPLLSWWKNLPLIFSRDFLVFSEGQFRPLSYALLSVVRTFVGVENLLFWHVWLLAFHGLNAILVFVLVQHFSKHTGSAALAAAFFGLHPLTSVMVSQINYFHYLLGLTFYLSALCCYLSFVRTPRRGRYGAAVLLFILGLFTSKIVFTLPLILVAYEMLYQRSGLRVVLVRVLPFLVLSLLLSPLWWFYKPHPLHYIAIEFPTGTGWDSFFSVVGATGWYAKGLLLGWGIPVVLHEVVERIYACTHWKFLFWGIVDLGILIAAGWAVWRKRWVGMGGIFLIGGMLPFASTLWNGVEHYVSWSYLYVPLVGWAFLLGGGIDELWSSGRRSLRAGMWAVLGLVVLGYGTQQIRINMASRSATGYWNYVLRLHPGSEVASFELGKAYLQQGETAEALPLLFSPAVTQIHASCLAMSRYYCAQGDLLAAAIHLEMAGEEEAGLRFQRYERTAAELFYAAGSPDHAEDALGKVLMANPYNIAATEQLVRIWLLKGYVNAASGATAKTLEIAPSHAKVRRMRAMVEAHRKAPGTSDAPQIVRPPDPGWLRYVLQGIRDPRLQKVVIQSSEGHRNDPVIQMEAGVFLVRAGQHDRALSKLDFAVQSLSSAHAWAIKCWALTEAGDYEQAEEAGRRALELDSQNPRVHAALGLLFGTLAEDARGSGPAYQRRLDQAIQYHRQAIQLKPKYAAAHNKLGNLLADRGRLEEAIEQYRHALRVRPDYAEASNNLGIALAQQGKSEEAIAYFRKALRINPDYAEVHNNLGIISAQQGASEEAIAHFQQALRLKPDYAEVHNSLGIALAQQGESGDAIAHFRKALSLKPDYTEAWKSLGSVLMEQRRFGEVIPMLQERLARAPDDLGVVLKLTWLLATCPNPALRHGARAVQLAEEVCRKTGHRNTRALDILAAAYAEEGRFEEAIRWAEQALQMTSSSGQSRLAEGIEKRLRLYKAHRAYHE